MAAAVRIGIAALAVCIALLLILNLNSAVSKTAGASIDIQKGMSAGEVAHLLKKKGYIRSAILFRIVSKSKGYESHFRSGRYKIPRAMRTDELARYIALTAPGPIDIRVTIPEGSNSSEIASLFFRKAKVDSQAFAFFARDRETAKSLGIDNATLEGYLYPETYFVVEGAKARDVIKLLVEQYRRTFTEPMRARARFMGMTVNQVMTLASLIETEAASDVDRPIISQVFHRRLKLGYPLQANPTIQYILGEKRRVMDGDLQISSPFNTYLNKGLPPGPIASPGLKSITAALYPAGTDYLYFVSNGNGVHVFSRTLNEHQNAVSRYLTKRAQQTR
jgi:UPF0755 protein